MSNSTPSLDEWRRFLTDEMNILDKVWENELDDVWPYTPNDLTRTLADIADEFYQAYWEMFRAVLHDPATKSWDEMKRDAKKAASDAVEHVSRAWETVVRNKITRVERAVEDIRATKAPLQDVNPLLREAKAAQRKAEKCASRDQYDGAIHQYRDAMKLITQCEDQLEEAKRQLSILTNGRQATLTNTRLTKTRVIVAIIAALVALCGFIFVVYRYLQTGSG